LHVPYYSVTLAVQLETKNIQKTKIMNEQIQNILNENGTKTSKIQKLLALGLTRRQVADLAANGNYGFVQNVYKRMMQGMTQGAAHRGQYGFGSMINVTERTRACSTQTLSYASGRVLVRLNTCGLLKRASLERKKSAGGESNAFLRLLH